MLAFAGVKLQPQKQSCQTHVPVNHIVMDIASSTENDDASVESAYHCHELPTLPKFIIFDTKFTIFNAKFINYNTKFII